MSTAQGAASGTPEFFFTQTAGVEVQVPNGLPSLAPSAAPYVDPGVVPFSAGAALVNINKTVNFTGAPGTTIVIANPA